MKFIKIKSQQWQSENLSKIKFQNGDPIKHAQSDEDWKIAAKRQIPAYCYPVEDGQIIYDQGCLYNWFAVNDPRGLAPMGWRIPNSQDIDLMRSELDGFRGAPVLLKSNSGWPDINLGQSGKMISGNGQDAYGFNAKPVQPRYIEEEDKTNQIPANSHASYWLSNHASDNESSVFADSLDTEAKIFSIGDYLNWYLYGDSLFLMSLKKYVGLPVRCISNQNIFKDPSVVNPSIASEVQHTYAFEQLQDIINKNFPTFTLKNTGDF